ncbi:MAG: 3-hydroxyacyl-CoA dehydrogenase NAD-binding domain-containing protein, partial [Croceimicrobium sp.]
MQKIAVIGAGTMGNGIAHVFAQNGFDVNLIDISEEALERGISTVTKNLDRMIKKGAIDEAKKEETLA